MRLMMYSSKNGLNGETLFNVRFQYKRLFKNFFL
jgi:hypothetical protein